MTTKTTKTTKPTTNPVSTIKVPEVKTTITKVLVNKPIKVKCNDVEYVSICAAMRANNIPDVKPSPWFKINKGLKKNGEYQLDTFLFKLV